MKTCGSCKIEKPLSEFYRRRELGPDGRKSICKKCSDVKCVEYNRNKYRTDSAFRAKERARLQKWGDGNPEKRRLSLIKGQRKMRKKQSEELGDYHVKHVLAVHCSLKESEIPQSLIDVKRQELLIKRELKRRNV